MLPSRPVRSFALARLVCPTSLIAMRAIVWLNEQFLLGELGDIGKQ